uniref:Endosome-associated-trafficking regulator 1 n=1 Tax=Anopheles triannulatus TaxID=58253 RepID=A0A2M4AK16_9DIPT
MANDNNDINTDELTAGSSSAAAAASSSSACSATGKGAAGGGASSSAEAAESTSEQAGAAPAPPEVPRREENPFSFKHFLKWDGPLSSGGGGGSGTSSHNHHTSNGGGSVGIGGGIAIVSSNGSINHSRSTSNINGHGTIANDTERTAADGLLVSGPCIEPSGFAIPPSSNAATSGSSATGTGSPSKSATTSSLHVVSSTTTGARPKIPQFQSVNTLSSESKMKRSPRFPSFDSQSSLSDFAADELRFPRPGAGGGGHTGGSGGIYTSRSNSSFCSGRLRDGERIGDDSVPGAGGGYVQRSYSHYDIDPDSPDRDGLVGDGIGAVEDDDRVGGPAAGRLVGASAEFSAALPDFVQDHLVMEQWYNTLPKGAGSRTTGGSAGPVLAEFEHGLGEPVGRGDVQPALLNDMPFDLTGNIGVGAGNRSRATGTLPLDLDPATGNAGIDRTQRRITPTPSADLPPDLTEGGANGGPLDPGSGIGGPYYYPGGQLPPLAGASAAGTADKIHRLPDFLSDGPIHSSGRLADVTHDTPHGTGSDERANHHRQQQQQQQQQHLQQQHQRELHYQNRLEMEQMVNERLRRELDSSRRTVGEQSRRIRELERDLETMVSLAGPQRESHHLHHSLTTSGSSGSTQSNANSFMLAKSRAATAEAEVQRLKQKLAGMSAELETLRRENERLKECEGAIGGTGAGASALPRGSPNSPHQTSRFLRSQTLALRQAAASAENNLRQLLSGVENLRSMANEIESFNGTFSPGTHGESSGARVGASISETYRNDDDVDDVDDDDDDDDEGDDDALGPAL